MIRFTPTGEVAKLLFLAILSGKLSGVVTMLLALVPAENLQVQIGKIFQKYAIL